MKKLINVSDYCRLYYEDVASTKNICAFFGCKPSSLGAFRNRLGLPNREEFYPELRANTSRKSKNLFKKGAEAWNKGKPFPQIAGENHVNWKGGKFINIHGYRIVKAPRNHPHAYKGYMREHRLIVENFNGRYLKPNEHVHHIDHDKLNNDISNLIIVSPSEHAKVHQPEGSLFGINAHK